MAYNLSGVIARGEIVHLTRSAIHILALEGGGWYTSNIDAHISLVKNGRSTMVLREGDHAP